MPEKSLGDKLVDIFDGIYWKNIRFSMFGINDPIPTEFIPFQIIGFSCSFPIHSLEQFRKFREELKLFLNVYGKDGQLCGVYDMVFGLHYQGKTLFDCISILEQLKKGHYQYVANTKLINPIDIFAKDDCKFEICNPSLVEIIPEIKVMLQYIPKKRG